MSVSWLRRAALVVAIAGSVVLVGSGSAGPRLALADFDVFPGPGTVTYGELIAYKGTFTTQSGSTLTHVRFRQTVPTWASGTAIFDSSTCPSPTTTRTTSEGTERICDFGQVPPGTATLEVVFVWRIPATGTTTANCPECLLSTGRWTVKEGVNDTTDPNDVFGRTETKATLLGSGDGSQETLLAGGYEIAGTSCAAPTSQGNLKSQGVVSLANPVVTKFCLPAFNLGPGLGYAATITELTGNARRAVVCIAALGLNCPTTTEATFAAPGVTLVFQVADGALPKGYRITAISHNGEPPLAEGECSASGDCVLLIDLDNKTKIWTIVVTSTRNGPYSW